MRLLKGVSDPLNSLGDLSAVHGASQRAAQSVLPLAFTRRLTRLLTRSLTWRFHRRELPSRTTRRFTVQSQGVRIVKIKLQFKGGC